MHGLRDLCETRHVNHDRVALPREVWWYPYRPGTFKALLRGAKLLFGKRRGSADPLSYWRVVQRDVEPARRVSVELVLQLLGDSAPRRSGRLPSPAGSRRRQRPSRMLPSGMSVAEKCAAPPMHPRARPDELGRSRFAPARDASFFASGQASTTTGRHAPCPSARAAGIASRRRRSATGGGGGRSASARHCTPRARQTSREPHRRGSCTAPRQRADDLLSRRRSRSCRRLPGACRRARASRAWSRSTRRGLLASPTGRTFSISVSGQRSPRSSAIMPPVEDVRGARPITRSSSGLSASCSRSRAHARRPAPRR